MEGRWLTGCEGPSGWDPAEEVLAVEVDGVGVDVTGVEVTGLLADGWEAPGRVPWLPFFALGTLVDFGGGMMSLALFFCGEEAGELLPEEEAVGVPLLLLGLPLLLLEEEGLEVVLLCPFFTTLVIFFPANVMLDLACEEKSI